MAIKQTSLWQPMKISSLSRISSVPGAMTKWKQRGQNRQFHNNTNSNDNRNNCGKAAIFCRYDGISVNFSPLLCLPRPPYPQNSPSFRPFHFFSVVEISRTISNRGTRPTRLFSFFFFIYIFLSCFFINPFVYLHRCSHPPISSIFLTTSRSPKTSKRTDNAMFC